MSVVSNRGGIGLRPPQLDVVYIPLGAASYGGAERSLLEIAAAQQRKGLRVLVVHEAPLGRTDFTADAAAFGVPVQCVDWHSERGLLAVARGARLLFAGLDTQLVQFNISWRPNMWIVPVMARAFGASQLLGTMRAMPEPTSDVPQRMYFGLFRGPPLKSFADKAIGHVWAALLDLTVSVNREDYPPRLVREFGFKTQRLKVVQNGVRLPKQSPSIEKRRGERAKLGIPDHAFVIGYVGRLSAEKGLRYAIEALSLCDERAMLIVAGDGAELETLQKQVDDLGLDQRVQFLGYVNEPSAVFTAIDMLVVPSLWNEAFGRVVVEAMGYGTPVIATAVGGMQEIFEDGVEGFLVPKASAAAIAKAIDVCVRDHAKWQAMGLASRALALEKYSTERVAAEYGALYTQLGLKSAVLNDCSRGEA